MVFDRLASIWLGKQEQRSQSYLSPSRVTLSWAPPSSSVSQRWTPVCRDSGGWTDWGHATRDTRENIKLLIIHLSLSFSPRNSQVVQQTNRQADTQDRLAERQTDRQAGRQTFVSILPSLQLPSSSADQQTVRLTDRKADRQADGHVVSIFHLLTTDTFQQNNRQTHRQAGRQIGGLWGLT